MSLRYYFEITSCGNKVGKVQEMYGNMKCMDYKLKSNIIYLLLKMAI